MNKLDSLPVPTPAMVSYNVTITLEDIDTYITNKNVQGIIQPLWLSISLSSSVSDYTTQLASFTKEQQYIFVILWYISEVLNGGHDQFYSNSTGMVWEEVLEGLGVVGIQDLHQIYIASLSRFPKPPEKERGERRKQLKDFQVFFDDLDEKIFALNREEDLIDSLLPYIEKNKTQFVFSGTLQISEKLAKRLGGNGI